MPQQPSTTDKAGARGAVARLFAGRTRAQWYCVAVAILLGARGASTLLSGASFERPGTGWRAVEQLLVATALLIAQRTRPGALRVLAPFAALYVALWVAGVANGHEAFGLIPINLRDKIIYPVYFGLATLILLAPRWLARRAV